MSKNFDPILQGPFLLLPALSAQITQAQKYLRVAQVTRYKGRHSRQPAAAVGDFVTVTVKKGPAELRKQIYGAVIVRQKYPIRRLNGVRVAFEDNARSFSYPGRRNKGNRYKGTSVLQRRAEKWPRIANLAGMIV